AYARQLLQFLGAGRVQVELRMRPSGRLRLPVVMLRHRSLSCDRRLMWRPIRSLGGRRMVATRDRPTVSRDDWFLLGGVAKRFLSLSHDLTDLCNRHPAESLGEPRITLTECSEERLGRLFREADRYSYAIRRLLPDHGDALRRDPEEAGQGVPQHI